ncbi:MAG: lipopolysaccharide biosynthesis protein, partial [Gammaproteobacteria bacterium]
MSSATGSPLRRVVRNFLTLLGGRAAGGVLAFLATVLSARLLGPAGFGIVALVHAYVMIVRGLVNIKPFEAIVRFGVPLLDDRRHAELGRLLRACLLIDLCSAAGGAAVAAAGVPLMAALGVWDATANPVALAYALALLCSGQATASGVLRIFDRFDAISGALVIANGARLLGVVLGGVIFDGG